MIFSSGIPDSLAASDLLIFFPGRFLPHVGFLVAWGFRLDLDESSLAFAVVLRGRVIRPELGWPSFESLFRSCCDVPASDPGFVELIRIRVCPQTESIEHAASSRNVNDVAQSAGFIEPT